MKRLIAFASLLAVFAALAIEPPKTAPPPEPPPAKDAPAKDAPATAKPATGANPAGDAAKSATGTSPADAKPDPDEEELPPLPPDAAPAGPPPQRFNPTEKVRADFPVSFPIDI